MLHGLSTIWRDAVGATTLNFHVTGQTLVIGIFASVVVSTITIWLALRKFVKRSPRELLAGEIQADQAKAQSLKPKVIGSAALVAGLALVGWAVAAGDTQNAGIFFGAGALVLIAGLSFVSAWLVKMEREAPAARARNSNTRSWSSALHSPHWRSPCAVVRGGASGVSRPQRCSPVAVFSSSVHRRVPAGCESGRDAEGFRHGRLCAHGGNDVAGGAGFEFAASGSGFLRAQRSKTLNGVKRRSLPRAARVTKRVA
jgi:hypothetical protein